MRAEHRHKLHRNELADWLSAWNQRIKPYSNAIFIGVLVVAVGIVAVSFWTQRWREEAVDAWDRYYQVAAPASMGDLVALEELEGLAVQTQSRKVAHCAALTAADLHLARGCQEIFKDKFKAGQDLRRAVEHYRLVQDESREPILLEQACYGLARAYEALAGTSESQGSLQKAVETYQELVDTWPNGPYAERASARLEDLNREETKAFYDQFAQFDPKPAEPSLPGLPGGVPEGGIPFEEGALTEDSPVFGPGGAVRPDWTEESEEGGPELAPAEGAGPSQPPSPKEAVEPEKPAPEGTSETGDTPKQDAPEPQAPSTPDPAPAVEGPDPAPAAADEPSDPGSSPAEESSEASP